MRSTALLLAELLPGASEGKNVWKKADLAYKQEGEGTSHLYGSAVKPDSTVRVDIDEETICEGSLKADLELLAPKRDLGS